MIGPGGVMVIDSRQYRGRLRLVEAGMLAAPQQLAESKAALRISRVLWPCVAHASRSGPTAAVRWLRGMLRTRPQGLRSTGPGRSAR